MLAGLRHPLAATEEDSKRQGGRGGEGETNDAKAADFQEPGERVRRPGHCVVDTHLIVGH